MNVRELLNLADKAHNLAEYWRAQALYWDNQMKKSHDAVLFCREKQQKISEIRRRCFERGED